MTLARNILKIPLALLYVVLVVYSRHRRCLRRAAHATACASFVFALGVAVVLFACRVGVVAY
jgi:hypothetical protein